MSILVYKILVIFTMIFIGFIVCKTNLIPFETNKYLINVLIHVLSPCLLITAITHKELTPDLFGSTIQMLIGAVIYFFGGAVITYGIAKALRVPEDLTGQYSFMMLSKNTAFMGFPVTKATFGAEGLYFMVIFNIISNIYSFSAGIVQIGIGSKREKRSLYEAIKPMLNANTAAGVIGIIMLFAGLHLPALLDDVMTPIGDATIPMSMLVIGIQLADSNFKKVLKNRSLILAAIVSLTVWPAIVFLAVNWLPLYSMVKVILVFAGALPTLVVSVALSQLAGKDATLAAEMVSLSTSLSMASLPIVSILLTAIWL